MKEVRNVLDPNKHCPLHRKPYPLRKCRGFRQKSINDRKQLLKEHYICFRCCSSTDHLAKNCTAEIKCTECGSATHVTALHPYPPTWKSKLSPSTSEDGGEEDKCRGRMPNNRKQVFDRFISLQRSLEKRPKMKVDFLEFMEKMFEKAHAEVTRRYSLDKSVGTCRCSVCIIQGNQIEFMWSSTAVHHMKECRSTISCSLVPTLIIAC